jgi:hypothetical protein
MNLLTLTWAAFSPFTGGGRFQLAFTFRGPTIWALTPVGLGSAVWWWQLHTSPTHSKEITNVKCTHILDSEGKHCWVYYFHPQKEIM